MCGWFSAEIARASRWKRSVNSLAEILIATLRPSRVSTARYTWPIPPEAIAPSIWNGPNCEPTVTIVKLECATTSFTGESRILPFEASCASIASTSRRNSGSASASKAGRSASAHSRAAWYSCSICCHRSGVIGNPLLRSLILRTFIHCVYLLGVEQWRDLLFPGYLQDAVTMLIDQPPALIINQLRHCDLARYFCYQQSSRSQMLTTIFLRR